MKRAGEKMYSYVNIEKELTPEFRAALKSMKDANSIADLFIETIFKLLKKIKPELNLKYENDIVFAPEAENNKWSFEKKLSEKFAEEITHSDLESIVNRFAVETFKWYEHIGHSDESRVFFKGNPGEIIHGR